MKVDLNIMEIARLRNLITCRVQEYKIMKRLNPGEEKTIDYEIEVLNKLLNKLSIDDIQEG